MKGIREIHIAPNGMIFVGDKNGNQMPKFQGKITRKLWNKIKRHKTKKTVVAVHSHHYDTDGVYVNGTIFRW